ncbi:MAG: hypothetical protein A3E00_11050 [Curvibacter sp. RIFCSPHIGHO2_12_FULL_63_18]|uniref:hypothetical protein n=1 Tax=Rhodoferax sp. TaxID=50421 RepID=UPI0008C4C375|nr:hypothetical protein [Rhodoferax sp.]OGO94772.1 MAG: hypothetical protein A2037_04900 [Curvibacter sp. GWA2_63_95]OGP06828.1 MAG: hypothetical protein A3E00_11050 [Curvibacter sp. RIFCSPHIGHO2_12_FULL_63_18]HCX80274.1 hypothetical protein [Rhodoferax sp.]
MTRSLQPNVPLDLGLRQLDGLAVIQALFASPATRSPTKVVMMTARLDLHSIRTPLSMGLQVIYPKTKTVTSYC